MSVDSSDDALDPETLDQIVAEELPSDCGPRTTTVATIAEVKHVR